MRALRVLLCAMSLTLAGCTSTRYLPVNTVRDHYHTLHSADTMIMRDSVVIDRAGDTIRESRWRDRWHRSVIHDTVATCDTIREPYPVEVPARLTFKQRAEMFVTDLCLTILILTVIAFLYAFLVRKFL